LSGRLTKMPNPRLETAAEGAAHQHVRSRKKENIMKQFMILILALFGVIGVRAEGLAQLADKDLVLTLQSKFYRAQEAAKLLGVAEVTTSTDVSEGGLVVSPNENNRRTKALRQLLGTPPAAGKNTVIVSHKPNLIDAGAKISWIRVKEKPQSSSRSAMANSNSSGESLWISGSSGRNDHLGHQFENLC
jgi:phosphohistidine phosphatase SixA